MERCPLLNRPVHPAPGPGKGFLNKKSENIYFLQSFEKHGFRYGKIPHISRLKTEQHAYMFRTPIIHVEILRNFTCFFNGGFS
jgi:hypothetical protein